MLRRRFPELADRGLAGASRLARALTRNRDQADDLVQDVALRLLAAQEQYRTGSNFRAWAIMALRNRFIDLRRRARFHGGSIENIDPSRFIQPPPQDTAVFFEQTVREFWLLPDAHREVITMISLNGMSYEEVAQILNCPIGTVRSRLARARAELQLRVMPPVARQSGGCDRSARRRQRPVEDVAAISAAVE